MNYFDDCMTNEQLEKEHRRLVIKMHPDRNPNDPEATAKFQEMQAQYEERKAELNGDYRKSAKGRERRERERREREERERKERERNRLAEVLEQARKNKTKKAGELKAGDYVYARAVEWIRAFSPEEGCLNDVLRMAIKRGVKDETVVKIEAVFDIDDAMMMDTYLSYATDGDIYGGWETIQQADPANGIRKAKRVAKVVLFRSKRYCIYGNPQGDQIITDFYLPCDYETMFSDHLHRIQAGIEREQREAERIEAERKARIEAEQQTVAASNLKAVLRGRFPGVTFAIKTNRHGETSVTWEDGPTVAEVVDAAGLFNDWLQMTEPTPWQECFGKVTINFGDFNRKMNVLTKARILQQLGGVTDAFCQGGIDDEVTVSDDDWTMLHLMVGVSVGDEDATLCRSTMQPDGTRRVHIGTAVRYVFEHTSYAKAKTTKKTKRTARQAA